MEDIKVHYTEAIAELNLEVFGVFVLRMQKQDDKYRGYTAEQYYLLLLKSPLYNKFMKTFLESIKKKKIRLYILKKCNDAVTQSGHYTWHRTLSKRFYKVINSAHLKMPPSQIYA